MKEKSKAPKNYVLEKVISRDGTTIGYRQFGSGPGLILIPGGMMAAQNFLNLATALSDTYTVYVPDRRGRGLSGPFGNDYKIARECEDIQAIIDKTGANYIFGLSSGALITLQSSLVIPSIQKAALYEPPLPVPGYNPAAWATRYEREISKGKLAAAMITAIKGTGDELLFKILPGFILEPLFTLALKDNRKVFEEDVLLKDLIPTLRYDIKLVNEMNGKLDSFKDITADVLLLGGSKSQRYLKEALNALEKVLPRSRRIEFQGLGHTAADNTGKPELVAEALKMFFI